MSEFGRLNSAVDQMFDAVERKPFTAFSPDSVMEQRTDIPLEPMGPATDIQFPPSALAVLKTGLPNGDFREGPEDPTAAIDDIQNKLPGWKFVQVQGTSMSCTWGLDASTPTGRVITWTKTGGNQDDEAYLESIGPVEPASARTLVPFCMFGQPAVESTLRNGYLSVQFLKDDLTTTGTEVLEYQPRTSGTEGDVGYVRFPVNVPVDARFIRVRLGFKSNDETANTGYVYQMYAGDQPRLFYATMVCSATDLTADGSQPLYIVSGNATGVPDNAANRFIAFSDGWVSWISVRLHDVLTAGSAAFRVFNEVSVPTAAIGPTATLTAPDQEGIAHGDYDASTNYFTKWATLRVRALGTADLAPVGRDSVVHVGLVLIGREDDE